MPLHVGRGPRSTSHERIGASAIAEGRGGRGRVVLSSKMKKRRVVSWAGMLLMSISGIRTCCLICESLAEVREERQADAELVELCRSGAAKASPKMKAACLRARADGASPLLMKAVVRSVATAWSEFTSVVSTPWGVASVLLFLLSSFVLPIVPWLKLLGRAAIHDEDDDDLESDRHVIVLAGHGGLSGGGLTRRSVARLEGPGGWVDC